jgi:hypothetical protein
MIFWKNGINPGIALLFGFLSKNIHLFFTLNIEFLWKICGRYDIMMHTRFNRRLTVLNNERRFIPK